jgi:hypothetical protein
VNEHRHDGFRVDCEKLGLELLACEDVDVMAGPLEPFLGERKRTFAAHADDPRW